jgi:antitoxin (DNA-binding transcriptional repressor) of toxin-antitoxin stability system
MSATISQTLPLAAMHVHFSEWIAGLSAGEELILTAEGFSVTVVKRLERTIWPSVPGTAKDRSLWMAPDFDAPLEDFAEYMT